MNNGVFTINVVEGYLSSVTVQGGDGFYNRIDPTDSNIIYAESQDGNLSRRDLRTSESKSIRPLEDNDAAPRYRFQWNSPLMIAGRRSCVGT